MEMQVRAVRKNVKDKALDLYFFLETVNKNKYMYIDVITSVSVYS